MRLAPLVGQADLRPSQHTLTLPLWRWQFHKTGPFLWGITHRMALLRSKNPVRRHCPHSGSESHQGRAPECICAQKQTCPDLKGSICEPASDFCFNSLGAKMVIWLQVADAVVFAKLRAVCDLWRLFAKFWLWQLRSVPDQQMSDSDQRCPSVWQIFEKLLLPYERKVTWLQLEGYCTAKLSECRLKR